MSYTYVCQCYYFAVQIHVGRALFWGHQGLQRNLAAAADYFRMSAESGDAQSQYDYGIVLMKVLFLVILMIIIAYLW